MDDFSRYFVGAYATSPALVSWDGDKEAEFINALKAELGTIRGLELPFWGEGVHPHDSELFLSLLDPQWQYVMTCLPGNMEGLKANKHFGLASDNEAGRQQALAYYRRASEAVQALNAHFAGNKVICVAVATSPALAAEGVSSSVEALEKSLQIIAAYQWDGAKLVIEHCDSGRAATPPVKGFLSLEEELSVIDRLKSNHGIEMGITINWARSVIEARDASGANEHIKKAVEQGVLSGLMFSGTASDADSDYGQWSDLHLPIAEEPGLNHFEKTSLMTAKNVQSCLVDSQHQQLDYLGLKVLAMPMETAPCARRVGINLDTLRVIDKVIKGL